MLGMKELSYFMCSCIVIHKKNCNFQSVDIFENKKYKFVYQNNVHFYIVAIKCDVVIFLDMFTVLVIKYKLL